jgi:hypothetical protein
MKLVFLAAIMIVLLAKVAVGQKAQPSPAVPARAPKMEEVPTPLGTPEPQGPPDLLPESSQLPTESPDLRLPSPSNLKPEGSNPTPTLEALKPLSPEEEVKNRAAMAEIRALAMRTPRVIDLLKDANSALTDEARREFMRAYYHTLCTRMRSLEPSLGQTITAFERAEIRKLAEGASRISIVSHDLLHREKQRYPRRSD